MSLLYKYAYINVKLTRFLNGVQIANRRASLQTEYSNPMLLKQQLRIENERKISYS